MEVCGTATLIVASGLEYHAKLGVALAVLATTYLAFSEYT